MNEVKYRSLVLKARELLKARNQLKYEIAKIATEVCPKIHGGKVSANVYTVTRFAEDIGINPSTLHRWKREYDLVISKIGEKKAQRKPLEETLKRVDSGTPKGEVSRIYKEECQRLESSENSALIDIIKRLRNIDFAINHSLVLKELDRPSLEASLVVVKSIAKGLQDFLDGESKTRASSRDIALKRVAAL
jgi:transposase-like protein